MVNCYFDDMKCTRIDSIAEGFRIVFENKAKDEQTYLVLNEENFVKLLVRIRNRCETKGLIEIYNSDKFEPYKPTTDKLKFGIAKCKCGVEFLDKSTNYCGNCGQKLDWSDTN